MAEVKIYTTYSSAVNSLFPVLNSAYNAAFKKHYQTSIIFDMCALAVHEAFDEWVHKNGLQNSANEFRIAICKHIKTYNQDIAFYRVFDLLENKLPNEFNVRGVWTSKRKKELAGMDAATYLQTLIDGMEMSSLPIQMSELRLLQQIMQAEAQ